MDVRRLAPNLPQFTGLRGVAALLVLFFHVRTPENLELHFGFADAFSKFGMLGVDVFFVLSGFILTHVYGARFADGPNRAGLRAFGIARFARIYPLHVVTTFLMLGAYAMARHAGVEPTETSGYSWSGLLLGLALMQEWFGVVAPNPGSWSISVEFASYLIFPFFVGRMLKLPAYAPLFVIVAGAFLVGHYDEVRLLRSVTEFVMGSAAYAAARRVDVRGLSWLAVAAFAAPFIASGAAGHELAGLAALCFAATMLLMSGRLRFEPFRALCGSGPLVFLGEISYSVYLLQWFVWIGWKHVLARTALFAAHPYLMVLCAAASLVLCSAVSYHFFEKPLRTWLRGLGSRRREALQPIPGGAEV